MIKNRSAPRATVVAVLAYPDVAEAVSWLCRAFHFRERLRVANHRCQLTFRTGALVVAESGSGQEAQRPAGHSMMVRVGDVNSHHAHAVRCEARILKAPADYPYGERQYSCEDPWGHRWTFSQSIADVDPLEWGGTPVEMD